MIQVLRKVIKALGYIAYTLVHMLIGLASCSVLFYLERTPMKWPHWCLFSFILLLLSLSFLIYSNRKKSFLILPDVNPTIKFLVVTPLLYMSLIAQGYDMQLASYVIFAFTLYSSFFLFESIHTKIRLADVIANKLLDKWNRQIATAKTAHVIPDMDECVIVVDTSYWYRFSDSQMNALKRELPEHYILVESIHAIPNEYRNQIRIVFGAPEKSALKSLNNLQWLHLPSAGFNGYEHKELYSSNALVTSSSGVYGIPIAEYTVGLMLMMQKGLYSVPIHNKVSYGHDIVHSTGDFTGCTVLILGTGDIGMNIASRCRSLGSRVIGLSRNPGSCDELPLSEWHSITKLKELVGQADFVVLCLPESKETNDLIDRYLFKLMKQTSYLINVGRGNSVNQRDLETALSNGCIAGAALDVTTPDPLWPNHRLFGYRNLLLSMHHSSISPSNSERAMNIFIDRLRLMNL